MTPQYVGRSITLAIYPNARGLAWIAFEGATAPYDWGFCLPKRDTSHRCLLKLQRLIRRLEPETLVLEQVDHARASRVPRIEKLQRAMIALASDRGISISLYTKGEVRACFAPIGATTRQQIAEAVGRHIVMLTPLVPPARKPWEPEHRRMALFNAAALILTHESSSARA